MTGRLRRLSTVAKALRVAKELESHDGWDRERLARHQQSRLVAIARHAAAHSPYYRERLAGIELAEDLDVTALPTLDKATMLEHFDEIVTDSRLSLATVEDHLAGLERSRADAMLLGEYRAMASGGTTGRRGIFVYGRDDWTEVLAGLFRWNTGFLGLAPRLPRRRRTASIGADGPLHMTGRMARSSDIGLFRILPLDARSPLPETVDALNRHRPEALLGYPSVVGPLAVEQLAGRLRIAPDVIATTSEVRTAEVTEAIEAAWGVTPFNGYASTETAFLAADCDRHAGLHVFSDMVLLEVVDDDGRPVPPGEPGSRVLVTNLVNRTQPLIRVEMSDLVTVGRDPCPCGRPFPVLEAVDGRSDDVLELPGLKGGTVSVHPLAIRTPLGAIAAVREYRVVREPGVLRVEAVLAEGGEATGEEIASRLRAALAERGAQPPGIVVERVAEIPRHPGSGKRRLIESRA